MKIKKATLIILISFSIIPIILVTGVCLVNFNIKSSEFVYENLSTACKVQANNIDVFFQQRFVDLKVASQVENVLKLLDYNEEYRASNEFKSGQTAACEILSIRAKEEYFLRNMVLIDKYGIITASSKESSINKQSKFYDRHKNKLLSGESVISSCILYGEYGRFFEMGYPIIDNGNFIGCMMFEINLEYFRRVANETKFFNTGTIAFIDEEGNIAGSGSKLDYDNINEASMNKSDISKKWGELEFDTDEKKFIKFTSDRVKKIGHYELIGDTGWKVLGVVNLSEMIAPIIETVKIIIIFALIILVVAVCISIMIKNRITKPIEELLYSMKKIQLGNYNTRIKYNSNNEFGEIANAFNVMVDEISNKKLAEDELARSQERYKIILEQSKDIVFEWNMFDNTVLYSENFEKNFGYMPDTENYPQSAVDSGMVFDEDVFKFIELLGAFYNGEKYLQTEVRILKFDGSYAWCGLKATALFDDIGNPYKVIGLIADIDSKIRETEELRERAQRDTLTELYNKGTTKSIVETYLSRTYDEEICALIIIDIDNFKSVNDNMGHLFGDKVLTETARNLKAILKGNDIAGRIGGDEFVVFINDINNIEQVCKRAESITEMFSRDIVLQNKKLKISGSVGIAVYPRDGSNYNELFENADTALYNSKDNGKNRYSIYDVSMRKS